MNRNINIAKEPYINCDGYYPVCPNCGQWDLEENGKDAIRCSNCGQLLDWEFKELKKLKEKEIKKMRTIEDINKEIENLKKEREQIENAEKERLQAEKETRRKEVEDAYRKYIELEEKFVKDYKTIRLEYKDSNLSKNFYENLFRF
jgi:hypothetical protein